MSKTNGYWKVRLALGTIGRILMIGVDKAARDCAAAEEKTLRGILNYAKDSHWGKTHNFSHILSATSSEELFKRWQENVPPAEYEDLAPFIERHKQGEANVLFPGKPMMYATTSGTTKEPKWIPITKKYYKNVYSKISKIWLYSAFKYRPHVFDDAGTSIVGKVVEDYAPDGTLCGSVSGIVRRDLPKFIKAIYAEHDDVYTISDHRARYYSIVRMGLERDIRILVTPNPSTIIELQHSVNDLFEDYVTDIEKGTLSKNMNIEEDIRANISAALKPNPARAAELRVLKEKHGTLLPKHYWPNLQVLSTWKCGNTYVYIDKLKDAFPADMFHQEFGFFATECCPGKVLDQGKATTLFTHMNYLEFVPEEELSLPRNQQTFYRSSQLEKGRRYAMFVTTYAGLYRYNMNDLVEVTGFYGTLPNIEMVQKINGIISMTGEKLHEHQFMEAVQTAQKETGLELAFFVGFADLSTSSYQFYYEFADQGVTQKQAEDFTSIVDERIKEMNFEYKAKRDSFRIKPPLTHLLQPEAFEIFKERCVLQGARDAQFKLNRLMQDEKRHTMFKELVRE